MPATHTADFQTAALKATDLDAVEKVNVGLETELVKKHVNIIADAPEIRIQDKTGSSSETTMSIVADGGATHFRAGIDTFAEGSETKGDIKFQSSTGATTHAEIVGSSGTLELQDGGLGLKLGSNVSVSGTPSAVIQEITGPHTRDEAVLKKFPEVVFADGKFEYNHDSNTYTQGGYTVSASNQNDPNLNAAYGAFDGIYENYNARWRTGDLYVHNYSTATPSALASSSPQTRLDTNTSIGEYLIIKMPSKIQLKNIVVNGPHMHMPYEVDIYGRNEGVSTWTHVKNYTYPIPTGTDTSVWNTTNQIIDATEYYSEYAFVVVKTNGHKGASIGELELYGYEEVGAGDDSVDTTVKSVFNAPDLTSAALYIDGKKSGSTPTDYGGSSVTVTDNGTWDSSDNTWSLSGTTTSNVVSGNLASLVGDQPHSVSAWVKADHLNGSGLFHVGTAEGEGDAASRVGFVDDSHISWGGEDHFFSNVEWHNVTYTYNGEGSDKKLYLDGRHIGTAKNEDTFGDYPPFAMTDYRQYGYVVSASGVNSNYPPYYVFDDQTTFPKIWISPGTFYTTSSAGGVSNGGAITVVDGVNKGGEWVQIEFPFKLNVDYVAIKPPRSADADRAPQDGFIVGSNDGITWTSLREWTGITTWGTDETVANNLVMTKNGFYKYFRLIVTRLQPNNTNQQAHITEIQYYGHRENDLVRFPDPTNVLKYPHITVDEPAKRGYAVSQSSQLLPSTGGSTGYYHGYNVFDGKVNVVNQNAWISMNGGNSTPLLYDTNGDPTAAAADTVVDGTTTSGEWVQLKLPRKIKLSYLRLMPPSEGGTTLNRAPAEGVLAGSTDGTTWTAVSSWTGASYSDLQYNTFTANIDSTNSYNYLRLIVKKTGGATLTSIQELEFYGTESEDVVARVGDGFDGKVRNVRVYSTALSDARVQEIFDADKDEFGLAKSSVSVYRGHLGVGTTEPKAALTVMDEVAELEEFPPKPMMAAETYMEGHGNFKVCASSYYGTNPGQYQSYMGFKRSADPTTQWNASTWNSIAPSYSTTTKQVTSGASLGGYSGEWLKLSLPYGVKLGGYQLMIRSDWDSYGPGDWVIIGSNDDTTWHLISSVTAGGITGGGLSSVPRTKDFVVETTKYYKHLALVCSAIHGTGVTQLNFTGLRYFGTREQGASTLHNGELSLTRNLTVPRIGPPLDADDTPRRDRLVVEYNTSTNPMENGVVKDTSGRGHDGRLDNTYGGAAYNPYYDATEKALVFDGSNDYLAVDNIHNPAGDWAHSVSVWLKMRNVAGQSSGPCLYSIGQTSTNKASLVYMYDGGTYDLVFSAYGDGIKYENDYDFLSGVWYHMCVTYAGGALGTGSQKVYVNGVELSGAADFVAGGNGMQAMDLDANAPLYLSKQAFNHSGNFINGLMSNFKLYDVALTADEVKRLYDMGRCDEGHHVVNFSKTRVGIGLGDGEAPRGALDVRGDIYGGMPVFFDVRFTSAPTATHVGSRIVWDTVNYSRGGGFDRSSGTFTAPIAGVYKFSYWARGNISGEGIKMKPRINGSPTFNTTNDGTDQNLRGTAFMGNDGIAGSAWTIVPLEAGGTFDLHACSHGNTVNNALASYYNGFTGEYISSL